jgi:hypothetical protein
VEVSFISAASAMLPGKTGEIKVVAAATLTPLLKNSLRPMLVDFVFMAACF